MQMAAQTFITLQGLGAPPSPAGATRSAASSVGSRWRSVCNRPSARTLGVSTCPARVERRVAAQRTLHRACRALHARRAAMPASNAKPRRLSEVSSGSMAGSAHRPAPSAPPTARPGGHLATFGRSTRRRTPTRRPRGDRAESASRWPACRARCRSARRLCCRFGFRPNPGQHQRGQRIAAEPIPRRAPGRRSASRAGCLAARRARRQRQCASAEQVQSTAHAPHAPRDQPADFARAAALRQARTTSGGAWPPRVGPGSARSSADDATLGLGGLRSAAHCSNPRTAAGRVRSCRDRSTRK